MKAIFSLLLFTLLAIGCRKNIQVTGRIYNIETSEGMSNVKLTFVRNGLKDPNGKKIAEAFTDLNGNFILQTKASIRKGHLLLINGIEDSNIYLLNQRQFGLYDRATEYQYQIPFLRIKPLKLFYLDTNQVAASEIKMEIIFRHKYADGFYLNYPILYSDELLNVKLYPMLEGENYIYWKSLRTDSSVIEGIDTLYIDGDLPSGVNFYKEY